MIAFSRLRSYWHLNALILVSTVAISAGAGTALAVLVKAMVSPSLPFRSPDQLLLIRGIEPPWGVDPKDWLRPVRAVTDAATIGVGRIHVASREHAGEFVALEASDSILQVLGVPAVAGRQFQKSDVAGQQNVAMISESLWSRWWAGSPTAIGAKVWIDRLPFDVVGVYGNAVRVLGRPDILVLQLPRRSLVDSSLGSELPVVSGTVVRVQSPRETQLVASALGEMQPKNTDIDVREFDRAFVTGTAQSAVLPLMVVGLILGGGLVNIVLLYTLRLERMRWDVAIRSALGASFRRLMRVQVTEVVALCAVAGVAAAWIAWGVLGIALNVVPRMAGVLEYEGNTERVLPLVALWCATAVASLASLTAAQFRHYVCSSASMLQLRAGRSRQGAGHTQTVVVTMQIVATVALVSVAAQFIAEYERRTHADAGFDPLNLWSLEIVTPNASSAESERGLSPELRVQGAAMSDALILSALRNTPGVVAAGGISALPLEAGFGYRLSVEAPGYRSRALMQAFAVSGDFAAALGARLVSGRVFDDRDAIGGSSIAILDTAAAKALFRDTEVIDRTIRIAGTPPRRIVGVVAPIAMRGTVASAKGQVYFMNSHPVQSALRLHYVVRSDVKQGMAALLQENIRKVMPSAVVFDVETGSSLKGGPYQFMRTTALIVNGFGVVVIILAWIGLAGTVQESLNRQIKDVAIRVALGGTVENVHRALTRRLHVAIAVASVVGAYAAWLVTKWVMHTTGALSFASLGTIVVVAAVVCCVSVGLAWSCGFRIVRRLDLARTLTT